MIDDKAFLLNENEWPITPSLQSYCCLKSRDARSNRQFGVIFASELDKGEITVHERKVGERPYTWNQQKYESLDALVKDWVVD